VKAAAARQRQKPAERGGKMNSIQIKFLILIALVLMITLGFGLLIWRQTIKVEKKALAAKLKQKEYEEELRRAAAAKVDEDKK
jgi:predicted Holliday junction resolvase-like endonuclease